VQQMLFISELGSHDLKAQDSQSHAIDILAMPSNKPVGIVEATGSLEGRL